jgi:hypothetical protein
MLLSSFFFFFVKIRYSAPNLLCRCSRWSHGLFASMNNDVDAIFCLMTWQLPIRLFACNLQQSKGLRGVVGEREREREAPLLDRSDAYLFR